MVNPDEVRKRCAAVRAAAAAMRQHAAHLQRDATQMLADDAALRRGWKRSAPQPRAAEHGRDRTPGVQPDAIESTDAERTSAPAA
jgi:hypothetical protein